eukprot:gb/GFBE01032970.1/.p1 GENE.gb/GFBE01032970.1/~~gb/GFBE01032970.1/.p1  ORF type:complete len:401 (+),score=74.03 gb/GFBE01032970.1/:1-1203(+)
MAPQRLFGDSKVFCRGRFIAGPDVKWCVVSLLMVLVPSILWQVAVGSFFIDNYGVWVPLLASLLQVSSLVLMVTTALSDPGIMPRQKDYSKVRDAATKSNRQKMPPRYYDVVLRGHPFKLKYCVTCNIYRPPRCTHCSVCENCVERFDHHCPWLGNCIGKRNYWLFYLFVCTTGVLNVLVLTTSVSHLALVVTMYQDQLEADLGACIVKAMGDVPLSVALAVYSLGIVWFTCGLCVYHTYLVCTNQTTYEQIKCTFESGNPFHRGVVQNFRDVILSQVRPRYLDGYRNRLLWPRAPSKAAGLQALSVGSGDHWQAGTTGTTGYDSETPKFVTPQSTEEKLEQPEPPPQPPQQVAPTAAESAARKRPPEADSQPQEPLPPLELSPPAKQERQMSGGSQARL